MVMTLEEWNWLSESEHRYMVEKALKKGLDCALPNSEATELPPIA